MAAGPGRHRRGERTLLLQGDAANARDRVAGRCRGRRARPAGAPRRRVDDHQADEPDRRGPLEHAPVCVVAEGDRPRLRPAPSKSSWTDTHGARGSRTTASGGPEVQAVVPVAASTRPASATRANTAVVAQLGHRLMPPDHGGDQVHRVAPSSGRWRRCPGCSPSSGQGVRSTRTSGAGTLRDPRAGPPCVPPAAPCARPGRGPHPPDRRPSAAPPCSAAGRPGESSAGTVQRTRPVARHVPACRPRC